MEWPAVTILILNWNGKRWLEQFLPSVLATDYPNFRVLVADNASSDGSVAFLEEHFPTVEVLALEQNWGFAEGNNRALQTVETPYTVLLNSDVEVAPDWLTHLVRRAEALPKAVGLQPKIRSYHQPEKFEYAGAAGGWMDRLGYAFARGRLLDELETDNGQYDNACRVFWATGACHFLRTAPAKAAGLFDPDYFAHYEEIDYCWRMKNAGWEFWIEPAAVVYHVGGGTLPQGSARKTYLNFRNSLYTLVKNLPAAELWWKLPLRLCLDGVAFWKELLSGKPRVAWAIVRAHWALFGSFVKMWRKRRKQQQRPMHSLRGYYPGLLIWSYFVQGRRRFSQLVPDFSLKSSTATNSPSSVTTEKP